MYRIYFRYRKEPGWKYFYARSASELQEEVQTMLSLYGDIYAWRVKHV